jgi:hypothetical protein
VLAQRCLEFGGSAVDPASLILHGHVLMSGGPIGLVVRPYVGIAEGRRGDAVAALAAYDGAAARLPASSSALAGGIAALVALGRFEEAKTRLDNSRLPADALVALIAEAEARRQGQLTRSLTRSIAGHLRAHIQDHPEDARRRDQLIGHLLALGEFAAAHAVATTRSEQELVTWAGLVCAGRHRDAHSRRLAYARELSQRRPSKTATVDEFVLRINATNYAFGTAEAQAVARGRWPLAATRYEQMVREKVLADLQLIEGDTERLEALRQQGPVVNMSAETAFRSVVKGRRVLVVGPSPNHRPTQEQLHAADVVVTTRSRQDCLPSTHHTIAYIADETVRLGAAMHHADLEAYPNHIIVVRPSMLRFAPPDLIRHPRVRTMQSEDATVLFGTHFGLQRLLYDILPFQPTQVEVTGSDFFLGTQKYRDGYKSDGATVGGDTPRLNFSHDHAYDFNYARQLFSSAQFVGPGPLLNLLRLTVGQYLAALEAE